MSMIKSQTMAYSCMKWFLMVIRAATVNENTFIKGITRASIKRLQYAVNIKLHESGTIGETSCECVAGSRTNAHCKHVATVLNAVEHMIRDKIIVKYQAPTEKLQNFHSPRNVFKSTPIKPQTTHEESN